ncbi:PREDICTED: phosphate carrier protein, mitochondrial-like [Papilio polytes]|uniref:phosphate carrier protein, mitochondrial-like n=1 Tax=Papilio polytes TaxID=76194 RepID=UPI000676344B|nr:PREDICTED: phosphate carrier protein, mitochondrial-like [Papilio polytes]
MFASLLEAARKSPFHGPLTPALCDANELAPALTESVQPIQTIVASSEPEQTYSCEFGSAKYFALCGVGGLLSCGLTHTAVVPLDLVKCRLQVDPDKYKNVMNGFRLTVGEEGVRSLAKGWAPTLIGYSLQGLFKFGLYELFKVGYSDMLDAETAYVYRTFVYLAASASFQDKSATVGSIVSKLGWAGVWKGLGTRIVMIGTLTALQWFIFDGAKVVLRTPRPPPAEMPESMKKRLEAEQAAKDN